MRNFLKNTSGNITITVGLLVVPLMLAAGAAVDYSQFARKNSSMQNVTDSAALAVARDLQESTQEEIEAKVNKFLKANLDPAQYEEINKVTVTIPASKENVTVAVNSNHPTKIMRIAGIKKLDYTRESVVNAPTGDAEVMLVLDTTGSMSLDGKIDALRVSATQFVEDVLEANTIRERVKVGIVPFNNYVNVGLDNRNAPWMDVPNDSTVTETTTLRDIISSSGCVETTHTNAEGVQFNTTTCSTVDYGPDYETQVTNENIWDGCAGSRSYPDNLNDANFGSPVPGLLNARCPNRITQLTNDKTKLNAEIAALSASGSTYIPAGLTWGFRALSSKEPFGDGVSYAEAEAKSVQKIIILMSDGENQSSLDDFDKSRHTGTNLVQANQYTREVCNNIKEEGIKIFTIGFGNSIPMTTVDLLKECSTDGANYYNANDGVALTAAFSSITTQLSNLYLSK